MQSQTITRDPSTRDKHLPGATPTAPERGRPLRRRSLRGPRGRDLRFRAPRLRPARGADLGATSGRASVPAASAGCRTTSAARWRITDRGIAVVLVAALLVTVSALTVVSATAWRVTGEHYQVSGRLR